MDQSINQSIDNYNTRKISIITNCNNEHLDQNYEQNLNISSIFRIKSSKRYKIFERIEFFSES